MAWSKQFAKAFGEMWSKSGSGNLFSGAISKSKGLGEFQKTVVKALGGEKPFLNRFKGMSESQFKDTMASFADDLLEKRGIFANSNIVKDASHATRLKNNLSAYRQSVESKMTGEIENAVKVASTPKAPNINTGKTVVNNQSKPIEGTKIGSTEGKSTWKGSTEGPPDEAAINANQIKAEMQRKNQAQVTAEGTAQKEAEQTGAGSSDNGSSGKTPEPGNPTGNQETPTGTPPRGPDADDVQKAMDEQIANAKNDAWYNDEAARKHLADSKDADILRENTAFENKYKDISEEYKKGLGEFYEERNLKGKVKDAGKLREYQESWGARLQKAQNEHDEAIDAIKGRKVGVMDWVQGHDYDKAAVGIGALGFAGSVAFGGAKSNADLYSNPF